MKKRHPVRKGIVIVLCFCLFITAAAGIFFGIRGYRMYGDALAGASLEEIVEGVRREEHFTAYSELPEFYIEAVISVEDHRFREHCGIDPIAVCRAAWTDLKTLSFAEGGSTITQQLAKNLLFTQEKTIERKAAEIFAALDIEAVCSKEEIFELYANTVYFGSGYYGIYEAAEGYYDKLPGELTDYESAVLAGVPNAPSVYSPAAEGDLSARRAAQVLHSMVRNGVLTQAEADGILPP